MLSILIMTTTINAIFVVQEVENDYGEQLIKNQIPIAINHFTTNGLSK